MSKETALSRNMVSRCVALHSTTGNNRHESRWHQIHRALMSVSALLPFVHGCVGEPDVLIY